MAFWPFTRLKHKPTSPDLKVAEADDDKLPCSPQGSVNILKAPTEENGVADPPSTSACSVTAPETENKQKPKKPPWWRRRRSCSSKHKPTSPDLKVVEADDDKLPCSPQGSVNILKAPTEENGVADPPSTSARPVTAPETGKHQKAKKHSWWRRRKHKPTSPDLKVAEADDDKLPCSPQGSSVKILKAPTEENGVADPPSTSTCSVTAPETENKQKPKKPPWWRRRRSCSSKHKPTSPDLKVAEADDDKLPCSPQGSSVNILKAPTEENGVADPPSTSACSVTAPETEKEQKPKKPPWWRRRRSCSSKHKPTSPDLKVAEADDDKLPCSPQGSVNILKAPREENGVADPPSTSACSVTAPETENKQKPKKHSWWCRCCFCSSKKDEVVESTCPTKVKKATSSSGIKKKSASTKEEKPDKKAVKLVGGIILEVGHPVPIQAWNPLQAISGQQPAVQSHGLPADTQGLSMSQLACLGFPNLAQTCYMNSTLQSLLTLKTLFQEFSRQRTIWSSVPKAKVIREFVDVGVSRYSSSMTHKCKVLKRLKSTVSAKTTEFRGDGQEDAHEFLFCLLDQMSNLAPMLQAAALKRGEIYICPVETQFAFRMQSTRTCKGCGAQSFNWENSTNLSLDLVPGDSVDQSLQRYLMEEELDYRCECGADKSARQWSFLTTPSVLVLQLKRFRDTLSGNLKKMQQPVVLSRELLLDSGQAQHTADRVTPVSPPPASGTGSDEEKDPMAVSRYSLVSVLSHIGPTLYSGHYISDGAYREGETDDQTDRWLTYDDENVTETTGESVCNQRKNSAYVLFYEKQQ